MVKKFLKSIHKKKSKNVMLKESIYLYIYKLCKKKSSFKNDQQTAGPTEPLFSKTKKKNSSSKKCLKNNCRKCR